MGEAPLAEPPALAAAGSDAVAGVRRRRRGRGRAARAAADRRRRRPGARSPRVLLAGFFNLVVVAVAAPAGRALAAPAPARDAAGDRRPTGPGRSLLAAALRARRGARRSLHHSERAGRARRPRRPGGLGAALRHQPGAARVPGQRRPPRHRQAGRRPLPHLRRRAPTPTAPSASSSTPTSRRRASPATPTSGPNAAVAALGAVDVVRAALGGAAGAYSITEGKQPGAAVRGGGHSASGWAPTRRHAGS